MLLSSLGLSRRTKTSFVFVLATFSVFSLFTQSVWSDNIRSAYEKTFKDPFITELKVMPQPRTFARSVIFFEQSGGTILYDRDADLRIPPASLTKLVVIALTLEHISSNGIHLEERVPISSRAWAINAPPRSSLMFLEPKQVPTWNDLLLGLAVDSGNDAAVAVAEAIDGSVEQFVAHMNRYVSELGLSSTIFVEPSGYDEHNMTTARDFGYFVWYYLQRFPDAVDRYHSVLSFEYPYQAGLPSIKQGNRNDLLYDYPGADGLKTGYIDESGYNLAFTAQRDGMRLSGVILGGTTDRERFRDAVSLLDYGFEQFAPVTLPAPAPATIRVWKGITTLLSVGPSAHRGVLPRVLANGLRAQTEYIAEIVGPFEATTQVGEQRFIDAEGRTILSVPIKAGLRVAEANPVVSGIEQVMIDVRQWFGIEAPSREYVPAK